jgi:hypothetical protein
MDENNKENLIEPEEEVLIEEEVPEELGPEEEVLIEEEVPEELGPEEEVLIEECPGFCAGEEVILFQENSTTTIYFSAGEMVISFWLFMIFVVGALSVFWFGIIKSHIYRKTK